MARGPAVGQSGHSPAAAHNKNSEPHSLPPARGTQESLAPTSRSRRRRRASLSVARSHAQDRERALERALELEEGTERPRSRADCEQGTRPCPFVSCKHHLYLDVSPNTGTIKLNFPDLEVWELSESCALDVADSGPQGYERAGALLNVTRERIRQIEALALAKLSGQARLRELGDPK
jgi:hypothetical protein